jgi:hypothetical protein
MLEEKKQYSNIASFLLRGRVSRRDVLLDPPSAREIDKKKNYSLPWNGIGRSIFMADT